MKNITLTNEQCFLITEALQILHSSSVTEAKRRDIEAITDLLDTTETLLSDEEE